MFIEKGGDYIFDHTKLILKENEKYFHATIKNRLYPSLFIDVNNLQPVPIRDFWPPYDECLTRVPKPQSRSNKYFIKRPSLLYYTDETDEEAQDLSKQILGEAKICEIIQRNPHPNIAEYVGCMAESGSITGLCFVRHTTDLT